MFEVKIESISFGAHGAAVDGVEAMPANGHEAACSRLTLAYRYIHCVAIEQTWAGPALTVGFAGKGCLLGIVENSAQLNDWYAELSRRICDY